MSSNIQDFADEVYDVAANIIQNYDFSEIPYEIDDYTEFVYDVIDEAFVSVYNKYGSKYVSKLLIDEGIPARECQTIYDANAAFVDLCGEYVAEYLFNLVE